MRHFESKTVEERKRKPAAQNDSCNKIVIAFNGVCFGFAIVARKNKIYCRFFSIFSGQTQETKVQTIVIAVVGRCMRSKEQQKKKKNSAQTQLDVHIVNNIHKVDVQNLSLIFVFVFIFSCSFHLFHRLVFVFLVFRLTFTCSFSCSFCFYILFLYYL